VTKASEQLPSDLAAAHAMILAERAARMEAEAEAARERAQRNSLDLELDRLRFLLAKLRHAKFGSSAERAARIEQLELALEDAEETIAAAVANEATLADAGERVVRARKPARRPLPAHLPRTRLVYPTPTACPCCGGRLRKLGEDVTETLDRVPARWFVRQHVREKFSCRSCETIVQAPAPSHPIERGRAGAGLLAEIAFGKFGLHLPLHRQSATFAREGVDIDVSTLADWIGAVSVALAPLVEAVTSHVLAGSRLHADDTTVPVLAKGKARTGRLWTVVRDDRPFGGADPPAAVYFYSPDRSGAHPQAFLKNWTGILQADAFSGFGRLYEPGRAGGPIHESACWAHWRRKFFEIAQLKKAPLAIEAVRRIDTIFGIEREINGKRAEDRLAMRNATTRKVVAELEQWLRENRSSLSAKSDVAKAMDYALKRWPSFTRFLDDGRVCISNNAAERAMRCVAVGRRNWTFAGSDAGGRRAAAIYTLIETCKLNDVDPRAWLADVLKRLPDHSARSVQQLLPWNWRNSEAVEKAA
jgi:transposase